jgi:glycerol uptake facilitator protein
MSPLTAEFVGTLILVLLGNGVVANVVLPQTKGNDSGWIVIAFGWGMAVFVAVWCVGPYSGAHINPAVTLALAAAGNFSWADVGGYITAQLLGAIVGAMLVYLIYRDHYAVCDNAGSKLATFSTAPAIRRTSSNLISESFGTAILIFAILLAVEPTVSLVADTNIVPEVKIGLGTIGALPVGLLVFAIGLSLGGTTGYAINPARDLGPRIAHAILPIPNKDDNDWGYSWIPVVGPCAGAIAAAFAYQALIN